VQIYEPKGNDPVLPPEPEDDNPGAGPHGADAPAGEPPDAPFGATGQGDADAPKITKYLVGGAVTVSVARERVQYLNAQGKLITESLRDYTRINLTAQYNSLDQFLQAWHEADRKAVLLQELEGHGVLIDALALEVGKDLDPFDMLLYVAWNMPPLTRRERANRVKKRNVFTSYGPVARKVLDALIDKYADQGITLIESDEVLRIHPLSTLGMPVELIKSFGGRPQYKAAVHLLEQELYSLSDNTNNHQGGRP
jgi:type I restriction enzyme R subunit